MIFIIEYVKNQGQSGGRKDLHMLLIENNNCNWIYLDHLLALYTFDFWVFISHPVEQLFSRLLHRQDLMFGCSACFISYPWNSLCLHFLFLLLLWFSIVRVRRSEGCCFSGRFFRGNSRTFIFLALLLVLLL